MSAVTANASAVSAGKCRNARNSEDTVERCMGCKNRTLVHSTFTESLPDFYIPVQDESMFLTVNRFPQYIPFRNANLVYKPDAASTCSLRRTLLPLKVMEATDCLVRSCKNSSAAFVSSPWESVAIWTPDPSLLAILSTVATPSMLFPSLVVEESIEAEVRFRDV